MRQRPGELLGVQDHAVLPQTGACELPIAGNGHRALPPGPGEKTYTVQSKDDSCEDVAVIYGTSWKNIVERDAGSTRGARTSGAPSHSGTASSV